MITFTCFGLKIHLHRERGQFKAEKHMYTYHNESELSTDIVCLPHIAEASVHCEMLLMMGASLNVFLVSRYSDVFCCRCHRNQHLISLPQVIKEVHFSPIYPVPMVTRVLGTGRGPHDETLGSIRVRV